MRVQEEEQDFCRGHMLQAGHALPLGMELAVMDLKCHQAFRCKDFGCHETFWWRLSTTAASKAQDELTAFCELFHSAALIHHPISLPDACR